jgi:D-alanyl-lipoteichoic acid acyltransferase DltB (MBOAT superfamily)
MLFNSLAFLVFFALVVPGYYLLPLKGRWSFLLAASCYFYMVFIPKYILVLAVLIAVDYSAGLLIAGAAGRPRTRWLVVSLATNIAMLGVFKYFNFVSDNLTALLAAMNAQYAIPHLSWALPLGLSFHTFQSMAYTIEVYRGHMPPERNVIVYSLYVMFFPQLVAGPIERPRHLIPQFYVKHTFSSTRLFEGLNLIVLGFFKKLFVADRLAEFVDNMYTNVPVYSQAPGYLILATYAFAFQIYGDFSGYSDIARGAAKILGYDLVQNFDLPYSARSIGEFWRRWHISLSTWFRDYVYLPLGGNRSALPKWCLNIAIVFLLSGLWHGANWTFVVWGGINGAYLIAGRLTHSFRGRMKAAARVSRHAGTEALLARVLTFNLVAFSWIWFRAASVGDGWQIVQAIFLTPLSTLGTSLRFMLAQHDVRIVILVILSIVVVERVSRTKSVASALGAGPLWRPVASHAFASLLIVLTLFGGKLGEKTFIYF